MRLRQTAMAGDSAHAGICDRLTSRDDTQRPGRLTRLLPLFAVLTLIAAAGGWHWLFAAGAVPVILSILPCAVTCGLGLGVLGLHNKAGSTTMPPAIAMVGEAREPARTGASAPSPATSAIVHHQEQKCQLPSTISSIAS